MKQLVSSGVNVLGGVSLKVHSPSVMEALGQCLCSHGLDIPPGLITTVYRVEIQGKVYYSKSYERVKKRNNYTIVYLSSGNKQYAFIDYFVYVHEMVFAILKPLKVLPVTCEEHFSISAPVSLIPVQREDLVEVCVLDHILAKCLFIEYGPHSYVVEFPSKIIFD